MARHNSLHVLFIYMYNVHLDMKPPSISRYIIRASVYAIGVGFTKAYSCNIIGIGMMFCILQK